MSRAWRIEYEGAYYHLLSRGNQGGDIFINEKDRIVFLDTIGEMSERFEIDVQQLCTDGQSLSPAGAYPASQSEKGHALVRHGLHAEIQSTTFSLQSSVLGPLQEHNRTK